MKSSLFTSCRIGLVLGAFGLLSSAFVYAADEIKPPLPLKRVVMLNSGVGYFEHAGQIEGNRVVEFPVNVLDINDLLKSLVVQDRGRGRVTAVNYGSPEPISNTLKMLAIDVTRNPSLAQIIHQLRGQKVELTVASDAKAVTGTVVGVERRRGLAGRDQLPTESDVILLRTEAGLRSVPVDSISLTKFLDPKTDREFQQALDLLAESRKQDQKSVKLNFRGEGARAVSVGYVQESPVWKTTYRLVLDDEKPPFLQGWAIVENTTAQDWSDVDLTLMSGRPISFEMDLYQPLFAARPLVELDLHTSVAPRLYNQDLASREEEFRAASGGAATDGRRHDVAARRSGGMGGMMGGMGGGGFVGGAALDGEPGKPKPSIDLTQGVASAASADDVGESFRYVIKTPVTLRRHESAMLPIVNDAIKGEKVYIFNSAVHAKHPLAGVKLTNATDLHLQQGPITVFDGGEYAGDAQIADVPPGSTRLISYAMDLDTEVVATSTPSERKLVAMSIQKGGLILKYLANRKWKYLVKNSGSHAKRLLIEQPVDKEWPNVDPKPEEKTRDQYRFTATAEPGKPATVAVTETQNVEERIVLQSLDANQIEIHMELDFASPSLRDAFKQLLAKKTAFNEMTAKREAVERLTREAIIEQQRLRENLKSVDSDDALHQRYLKKLAATEDNLESLQVQIIAAREEEGQSRQALDDFAAELSVD